jgi:hypothetical protein
VFQQTKVLYVLSPCGQLSEFEFHLLAISRTCNDWIIFCLSCFQNRQYLNIVAQAETMLTAGQRQQYHLSSQAIGVHV